MYLHLFASGAEVSGKLFGKLEGELFERDLFEVVSTKGRLGIIDLVGSVGVVDKFFFDISFQTLIKSVVELVFSNLLDTVPFEVL